MAGRGKDVSDTEILEVFRDHHDSMLSTREVADELPIKHEGTLKRLHKLASSGKLRKKEYGNQIIWSLPA